MKKGNKINIVIKIFVSLLLSILLFIAILAINSANYLLNEWGEINFATVMYQISFPLKGTNSDTIQQYLSQALYKSIAIFGVMMTAWFVFKLSKRLQIKLKIKFFGKKLDILLKCNIANKARSIIEKSIYIILIILISMVLHQKATEVDLYTYIADIMDSTTIFEEQYIDPENVNIEFKTKKNLLFIYMESMESSYADYGNGGKYDVNYIPNLTKMSQNNITFSDGGGLYSIYGTDWTMGALLGSSSGVPYKIPVAEAGDFQEFLPGLVTLGDVLQENGYKNYFFSGCA